MRQHVADDVYDSLSQWNCLSCARQFSRNFQKKNLEKTKKKNNFPEVLESRKVQNQKNLEKTKSLTPPPPQDFWNIVFFVFFGFLEVFLVLHFSAFQDLWKIVFFLFFSRFLYFFQGALPKDSQNVILDLFK